MASEQPYNSLGQILSQGGEIALGLAIAYGWSDSQIAALFARRFDPMSDEDKAKLIALGNAAVDAARGINDQSTYEDIDLDGIPVNPWLFGDQPGGLRVLTSVDVSFDRGDSWRTIRLELADIKDKGGIYKLAKDIASQRASKSPGQFPGAEDAEDDDFQVRFTLIERRF